MNKWNVEIRTTCKICGKPLPNARYRTYCSKKCREKRNNAKQIASGYATAYQKSLRDKIASKPSADKCQCLFCGKYYTQVGSHVWQVHKMKAGEYREYFGLDVKRGTTPEWYRKVKGEQAIENGTAKNLENGAKFRFKKGDKRAGHYDRSEQTKERLKNLHTFNKNL